MSHRTERFERGVASVHALTLMMLLTTISGACLCAVMIYGLKQKSSSGADFAALAASQASVEGVNGCKAAARLAKANSVELIACRMDAEVATVTTRASVSTPFGAWGIKSRARAAPAFYFE